MVDCPNRALDYDRERLVEVSDSATPSTHAVFP
jgi:hypothetical protein